MNVVLGLAFVCRSPAPCLHSLQRHNRNRGSHAQVHAQVEIYKSVWLLCGCKLQLISGSGLTHCGKPCRLSIHAPLVCRFLLSTALLVCFLQGSIRECSAISTHA